MQSRLDRIESRLREMIEGLAFLLPRNLGTEKFSKALFEALQAGIHLNTAGEIILPSSYLLTTHPDLLPYWDRRSEMLERLTAQLEEAAREIGFTFARKPIIELVADPDLPPEGVFITFQTEQDDISRTAALNLALTSNEEAKSAKSQIQPYLIIDGKEDFLLNTSIVNIGRREGNHVVLRDKRVSRTHAQLRKTPSGYVLLDLNSTTGTFVNGLRISQYSLHKGDVVTIGSAQLIFAFDDATKPFNCTNTSPIHSLKPPEENVA